MNDVALDRLFSEFIISTVSRLVERQIRIDSIITVWGMRLTDAEIAGLIVSTGTIKISTDAMINDIIRGMKENVVTSAQAGRVDAQKEKPAKRYIWQTASGDPCPDCKERDGQVHTMAYWEAVGTPDMRVTICGASCKCSLEEA